MAILSGGPHLVHFYRKQKFRFPPVLAVIAAKSAFDPKQT